ncbi:protein trichome birefringence-like 35 [Dendrobium catenatum]|uniref:Uncharacterized protein n=1 Tax=Dendrobium catenatum TaxID=906689 RepID=A0A2I0WRC5_9ASPA|nr:protein trichome birefringence-like 35 [Dendrobium catenatum]PKU78220.1 hypothetical protein MA16_Dca024453 [Dendrobium catenatum]
MLKWSRRRALQFFYFAIFSVFVLFSLLNDQTDSRIHGGMQDEDSATRPSFPTYLTTNSSNYKSTRVLGDSDWAKACVSSRSYKRRLSSSTRNQQRRENSQRKCDIFTGRWVYDNVSYPLYDEGGCPYMSDQLACTKHGRPDVEYQRMRWQPHGCNLKRWNGREMLEKLRNKRLMFVGDSLNRGQWISMVCLLQSMVPTGQKSMSPNAHLTIFTAEEYNATVEFYWAPLIVESNSDDPVNHRLDDRIIRPNAIYKHASQWKNADILVFNSYLWWRSGPKIKLLWNADDEMCEEADGLDAMTLALETWADWVSSSVNPLKQRVFFVTMSPTHLWSREWNPGSEGNCFNEKTPINSDSYWGSGSDLSTMKMVENILGKLDYKVTVINITQLSEYRKDGHPSIYRKFWETFSPKQLENPASYSDCIHWCLPGVPDVWNELLFNFL